MEDTYCVFKTEELYMLMGELALPPWTDEFGNQIGTKIDCASLAQHITKRVEETRLRDVKVVHKGSVNLINTPVEE